VHTCSLMLLEKPALCIKSSVTSQEGGCF
jgi:hypothetical protein